MGGTTPEPAHLPYTQDAWRIATVASRDLVEGDCVKLHASEVDAIDLTSAATDRFLGVVGQEYGGSASVSTTQPAGIDARPYTVLWGRNVKTRIEDSATVAYGALLALSGTTAGALVTATPGQAVVGICKQAITSGAVNQFTKCDMFPIPIAGNAGGTTYTLNVEIPDVSTASSSWVVAPEAGTIEAIYSVIDTAITVADATLTSEIGGTLVTGSSITITQSGSAAGDVDSATPTAANTLTAGQAIEAITDGGSTTASKAILTYVIRRTG